MIVVENITKSYRRKPVLRGVTFIAQPGQITLLVGPNGAGKSTTMKVLTGLVAADGGNVTIAGHDIKRSRIAAQRAVSYLPQNPNFHPRFSCRQVLEFYAQLRGVPRSNCGEVIETVGLAESARQLAGRLSGGMRQRLGLAVLLLADAPVLLLDEPGLSLDPAWRKRLQSLLHEQSRLGKTVLVTTHLIAEWNSVAHRCLLCRDGKIERELDPANLTDDFDAEDAVPKNHGHLHRSESASEAEKPREITGDVLAVESLVISRGLPFSEDEEAKGLLRFSTPLRSAPDDREFIPLHP